MSIHKSKKPSRRGSHSGSEDFGMPAASNAMAGESDTLHLMPGSEDSSSGIPAAGMHANDDHDGGMPGGGMEARDEEADDGMPGGTMGGGGGGSGSGGNGSGGGGNGEGETPRSRSCATMEVHRRLLSQVPSYARARDEIENQARLFSKAASRQRPGVTRIPVVVHVVWNTAAQNISDAQIASQIDVLNRDFRRTNPDVSNTPAPFLPLTADARIEFFLANVDPERRSDHGHHPPADDRCVVRSNDAVKSQATGGTERVAGGPTISTSGSASSAAACSATRSSPAARPRPTAWSFFIRRSAPSGTAAPPFHLGRTATHEIGHWLNLNHIWGDDGTGCSRHRQRGGHAESGAAATPARRPSRTSPAATGPTATCS